MSDKLPDVVWVRTSKFHEAELCEHDAFGSPQPYVSKSALDAMTAERDALGRQLEKDQRMVRDLLARIEQNGNDSHATYEKVSGERERAWQMLEIYGVTKERGRYLSNGIEVLMARVARENQALLAEREALAKATELLRMRIFNYELDADRRNCSECLYWEGHGHADDCALVDFLAAQAGEPRS